jgi:hypothetical protein
MPSGILHRPFISGEIGREGRAIASDPTWTILIVDDTESSARLVERLLTGDGHRRVRVACDAPKHSRRSLAMTRTSW